MGKKKRRKIRRKLTKIISVEKSVSLKLEPTQIKETIYEKASKNIRRIIDFWNSFPETKNIQTHRKTKTLRRTVVALRNILRSKSTQEVLFTIAVYHRLVKKEIIPSYQIVDLQTFLTGNKYRNLVAWYYILSDKKNREEIYQSAKYRKLIKKIKIAYCKHVLHVNRMQKFTEKQEKQFELAAWNLVRFIRRNKNSQIIVKTTNDDLIRMLIASLKWYFKGQKLAVGNLSSYYTYNVVLPQYLHTTRQRYF